MLDAVVAATLDDVQEAGDVGRHVDVRILRGVTHAGLGGQVDHPLRLVPRKHRLDGRAIGEVDRLVAITRAVGEARQPRLLQLHVVVVAEVVDADHLVAALEQAHGDMGADEAGGTGDEDFHAEAACGRKTRP